MSSDSILEKMNQGIEISNVELAVLLLSEMRRLHVESQEDLALFQRLTMAEFDKIYSVMATKADLRESEERLELRLSLKIEASHGVTNRRVDWLESKIKKFA